MDGDRFDHLSRAMTGGATRRSALVGVLSAMLGIRASSLVAGRGDPSGQHRNHPRTVCFSGRSCRPGAGQSNRNCDFSGSTTFRDLNAQGSNLTGANFANANLSGADLTGASLRDACLINANLTGAVIDGSTSLKGAIFCNTTMPDGSTRDTGCRRSSPCCKAGPPPGVGAALGTCRVLFNPTRCSCVNAATNKECGWVPGYGCQTSPGSEQCRAQGAICYCQT